MTDRMETVDHTHPAQDAVADVYRRGRTGLRADGGEDAETDTDAGPDARTRMRDVSHTPTDGDGTNEVWARGDGDTHRVEDPDDDE
jgi:hypothetical protein